MKEAAMTTPVPPSTNHPDELRKLAIEQLRKKRGLQAHLIAYVSVNAFLVAIWYVTGRPFFWPVFPILGWGIGLAFNIWDVYLPERMTEERIQQEMQRLSRGR
jgi:2TM domain